MRIMLLVVLAFGVACQKSPAPTQSAPAAKSAPAANATPAAAPATVTPQGPAVKPVPEQLPATVAKVNGEAISRDELERAVRIVVPPGQQIQPAQRDQLYRGMLDRLIAMKLLIQQSKAMNIAVTDSDIAAGIKQLQSQFPNEQAFTKALSDQKVTMEQLKNDQRNNLRISKLITSEVTSKITITPAEVDDFYAKNPDKFKEPEMVHAQHILIAVPQGADAAAKAKAKTDADAILKQIRSGADFSALAKDKSQDPGSAPTGGDLGFFAKGQMVPPFEEAAFKLKPGQVSPVVETPFGFHVIKVIERKAPRTVPLEEARQQLTEILKQQRQGEKADAYVAALKSKAKIEISM